ncbi:MAG: hypothetical protein E6772_17500 [Dysgonomonas sp.]|nr:hypothetical protein [Dysgonomonas sp.]
MKKITSCLVVVSTFLLFLFATGCSDDDNDNVVNGNNEDIVEGPSSSDVLTVPMDASFLGDSIRYTKTFALSEYKVKKVSVSTTQNGYIAVLGGYKDQSAIYIYAKADDDEKGLNDEQIKNILEKYYNIDSYMNDTEIVANVTEKVGVSHDSDFYPLRISIKVFSPTNVSTDLSIAKGSLVAKNVSGNKHTANSNSGAIKYINSTGKNFTLNSDYGYIGLINSGASESINTKVISGSIQLVLPKNAKTQLNLESLTRINAYILNGSNFDGTNTSTKVAGKLNGGGYVLNANSGKGIINLRWYENENTYY